MVKLQSQVSHRENVYPDSKQNLWRTSSFHLIYLDIYHFGYLPEFYGQPDEDTNPDDEIGLIVHDIQNNYQWLEHVEEDRPHRESFHGFPVFPELNVCSKETASWLRNKEGKKERPFGKGAVRKHFGHNQFQMMYRLQQLKSTNIPFLKARNSKTLCTKDTAMVNPKRYGLVSRNVVYNVVFQNDNGNAFTGEISSQQMSASYKRRMIPSKNLDLRLIPPSYLRQQMKTSTCFSSLEQHTFAT